MARRRRRKNDSPLRDVISPSITSPRLSRSWLSSPVPTMIEDRRSYHPLGFFRPARTVYGASQPNLNVKRPSSKRPFSFVPHQVQFSAPQKVMICVRRKVRREVIFAKRKAGGGARRRPRRNWYSSVSC